MDPYKQQLKFEKSQYKELLSKFENCEYEAAQSFFYGWNKDSLKVHISNHQNSILHYSCYNGWKELSIRLIEEFELDPNLEDHQGNTSLHMAAACKSDNVELVKYLISNSNCKPFQTNTYGNAILDIAIIAKNSSLVHYLVKECGCDQLCKTRGTKIMQLLHDNWDEDIARSLICDGGCQVTMEYGTTLLHEFAKHELVARVSFLLLECKCDPFRISDSGHTILDIAISYKNSLLVCYLVNEYGCDQLCKTRGMKIMQLLHDNWDEDIARSLICDGGCQVTMENGTTLLHEFAKHELVARVSFLLLKCKCDPFRISDSGHTILDIAISYRNSLLVCYLVNEYGCDQLCKTRGMKIMQLLHDNWDEDIARSLICDGGCQVTMENGTTLLHEFAKHELVARVSFLLLECKCDPFRISDSGHTILDIAISYKNNLVCYLVNEYGCDQLCKTRGMKIMQLLHDNWDKDIARSLICDGGCQVTMENGTTLLHEFASEMLLKRVEFLLSECHCDSNIKDKNENTILHKLFQTTYFVTKCDSIRYDHFESLILQYKCNPKIENKSGETVLHTVCYSLLEHGYREDTCKLLFFLLLDCKMSPHIQLKLLNNTTLLHIVYEAIFRQSGNYKNMRLSIFHYLFVESKCDSYETLKYYKSVIESICLYCLSPDRLNDTVCMTALHCLTIAYDYQMYLESNDCMYEVLKCNVDEIDNEVLKELQHHLIKEYPFNVAKCILHRQECPPELMSLFRSLIDESKVDLNSKDKSGNTLLHIACECFHGDTLIIEYIISTSKADPLCSNNDHQTPMMLLATSSKRVGAQQKVQQMISCFGKVKISHPIESYVNIVVLGNAGVGKSSLVKVINDRTSSLLSQLWPGYVKEVKPFTAGIIPNIVDDRDLGRIILHDLAGQKEYYSSHTAVLENLLQGSAAVFILVVSLADDRFQESFRFWLTAIENVSHNALQHCQLLVVASQGDLITNKGVAVNRCNIMQKPLLSFLSGKNIGYDSEIVKLDCRKLGGSQLNFFISSLSNACKSIVQNSVREMSIYCHLLYDFFQRKNESVFRVESLLNAFKIQTDLFLPTDCEILLEIIYSLSSTGLIVFLRNNDCPEKSWVVTDKSILLSDLDGVLFAPEDFNEHDSSLASNTGVVKLSVLKEIEHLQKYDTELLVQFLQYMQLCQVITEEFVNTLSEVNIVSNVGSHSDQYIFVPALIKDTQNPVIKEAFTFGWCIRCTDPHHSFLARFLHIIFLHLACKYSIEKYSTNKFERLCKVWSTGIHWNDTDGVQAIVELVDNNRSLVLLMRCQDGATAEMIELIKKVIKEILRCKQQVMPKIDTCEYIIDKSQLQYPVKSWEELTCYNIMLLADCYLKQKEYIIDQAEGQKVTKITELFPETTYTAEQYFELLFAGRNPKNLINYNFEIDINAKTNSLKEEHPTIANTSIQVSSVSDCDTTSITQLSSQDHHINSTVSSGNIVYSPELLRKYHAQICNVLAVSKSSYESLTLDFYSNDIIDELTKCSVLNDQPSLQGADNLLSYVKIVLNGSPEKFTVVLQILERQQTLKSIVQDIRNEGSLSKVTQLQTMQGNSTELKETDDAVIHGNSTVLESDHGNSTVLESDHGNSTVLKESDHGNSTVLKESDHDNSTMLKESDHGNSTVLIESDDAIHGNETEFSESYEVIHGIETEFSESYDVIHGIETEFSESVDKIHCNSSLTHSVTHDNTPYNILKTHTPVLLAIISDPDKLSDELWAKELLSDGVRNRIKTTLGISRYDKASMILIDVSRYLMVSDSNVTIIQFCDILINHGQPGLKEIAEKMIALLFN